jgi:hypothetical protein
MRLLLVLLAAALCAAPALADGLPVLGIDVGATGVANGTTRYVTFPTGADTVVAATQTRGGRLVAARTLPGSLTIPAVAYDFSAGGLSADGSTLVLIQPRLGFPRATTKLVVLGTGRFVVRRTIRLDGDYSFDAISPRGRLVYLIHYLSVADPSRYEVRVYDQRHARLLPRPVTVAGEQMRGKPLSRAATRDWAYTLYDGNGATPFVHALHTTTATARCLDVDALRGHDLSGLVLRLDGDGLAIRRGSETVATVSLTEP